ncbi:hypothetical protein [Vitreimonas flagellata]|uniref:hypothetical protein n=1 Tax=Vitreimonas flagellata TaxID=2560861 RepID=UPI001074B89E|nr:hypothetical protein [Vitreimonas flagellata]
MALAALTHRTKTGAPYRRPAAVEGQIQAALAAQMDAVWRLEGRDWSQLGLEALVYLARQRAVAGDHGACGQFVEMILARSYKIIARWSKGFSLADGEEIEAAVVTRLVALLLAAEPTSTAEFLEINAARVIKQLTLREVSKRRDRPRPKDFAQSREGGDAASDIADPHALVHAHEETAPIQLRRVLKAIKDRRHREAFILHKLRGWPVQSEKAGQPNLVARFNMSKRQIHAWIAIASSQVKHALGEA